MGVHLFKAVSSSSIVASTDPSNQLSLMFCVLHTITLVAAVVSGFYTANRAHILYSDYAVVS